MSSTMETDVTVQYITPAQVREAEKRASALSKEVGLYRADLEFCKGVALRFGTTLQGPLDRPSEDTMQPGARPAALVTCSKVRQAVAAAMGWRRESSRLDNKLSRLRIYRLIKDKPHRVIAFAGFHSFLWIVLGGWAGTVLPGGLPLFVLSGLCVVLGTLVWLLKADTSDTRVQSFIRELAASEEARSNSERYAAILAQQCQEYLRRLLPVAESNARNAAQRAVGLRRECESLEQAFRRLIARYDKKRARPGEGGPEAHFVHRFMIPLLHLLGWADIRREHSVPLPKGDRQTRGRADVVCFDADEPRMVIEAKARIGGPADVESAREQARGYAHVPKCSRFAVAAPEGVWVYDMHAPRQVLVQINLVQLGNGDVRKTWTQLQQILGRGAIPA